MSFTSTAWALALVAVSTGTDELPRFERGAVADLAARVVAAEAIVDGAAGALVEVEVENHGALYAEPLAFRFTPRTARGAAPGAPLEVLRVDFPHHGRAGGAVDPRGKRRYPLLVRLEADAAEACDVSVVRASFAAAAFTLDDPVAIGRLERAAEFRGELQRTIDVTRVTLENRSAHELDAVLRATYRAPKKAETLLRYRLAAGERREVAIEELPVGGGGTWSGAAVVELELVDACALLDDGAEAAAALFREAYGAWRALPADAPTLGARYALSQTVPGATLEASGAFVLRPDGTVELAPDAPGDDLAARAARSALREALAPVRRPSAEEVLGATRVALVAWGETSIVRLDSASFQDGQRDLHLWLEGGRIVADGLSPKAPTRLWTLRDEGQGYVVTARVHPVDFQTAPQQETRLAYTRVGALVLPSAWSDVQLLEAFPESAKRFRLTLDGWAVGVDPDAYGTAAPPQGELADLLRAAWEAPYRYPAEPAVLRGRFRLDNPGNDALWRGHRKLEGSFELRGFRGTRWDSWEVEVEGRKLGDEERRHLGAVVEDRLRMFAGRDFGGRPGFDLAFRGATLARDGAALVVQGAGIERVELAEGRPARLVLSGGARRELDWTRVGGRHVPARVATDGEQLRYAWTDLGDGWLWPKEVEMIDVFPDWGPERIRFTKLELERE